MSSQSQLILSPVQEFYKNKSVFITGASGFIGKVIVEKLLRTCGSLDRIYILLRPKKAYSIDQRFERLINGPVFNKLHLTDPKFYKKIIPINGDVALPSLGISEKDRAIIQENVHIVIHSAATIKFNEPLPVAININVEGVKRIVKLCKGTKHLNAFVHISTAYTNADRSCIEEKVYPFISNYYQNLVAQNIQNKKLNINQSGLATIESKVLGLKPNTYIYSKALAECYLEENKNTLPITIVRPSIVTAAASEPMEGFVDNVTALSGLIAFIGKGLLRAVPVTKSSVYDLIPVDYLTNLVILAAWKRANQENQLNKAKTGILTVYNGCSHNPITFEQSKEHVLGALHDNPLQNIVSHPKVHGIQNTWVYFTYSVCFQKMRAFCIDLAMNQRKTSSNMITMYNLVQSQMGVLEFFLKRGYAFERKNVHQLNAELSPIDKSLFPLFVQDLDWQIYFKHYVAGLKKYTLKEKEKKILLSPKARTNQNRVLGFLGPWRFVSSLKLLRR